ncbi:MAG TPA: VOC family protein [Xanthobacteraceae bacterium]|nr:VOC family protein [Xanthobacteraceae bacterium]
MNLARGARTNLVSRRQALILLGVAAAVRDVEAAEQAITQPVSLDHINIRVSSVAKTAEFYMGLFDTPVLRNEVLRAQPTSPPSEGFFLKFGDGYLAISQAFAPDRPDLDHYSVGLRDYDKAGLTRRLQDSGIAVPPRSSTDVWVADLDGALMQLRQPGGWARQTAKAYQGPPRVGPALLPLSMSRIGLHSADIGRAGDFYTRLFGTEIASSAPARSRTFGLGDSVLELISAPANTGPATRGLEYIRVAVKDFSVETATRVLRERGIKIADGAAAGSLRISDPDGLAIEIAAN